MSVAINVAKTQRTPILTPEHVAFAVLVSKQATAVFAPHDRKYKEMIFNLMEYIKSTPRVPEGVDIEFRTSRQFDEMIDVAASFMDVRGEETLPLMYVLYALMDIEDSFVHDVFEDFTNSAVRIADLLYQLDNEILRYHSVPFRNCIVGGIEVEEVVNNAPGVSHFKVMIFPDKEYRVVGLEFPEDDEAAGEGSAAGGINNIDDPDDIDDDIDDDDDDDDDGFAFNFEPEPAGEKFPFLTCVNDHLADHNPLIGREQELQRTIHVLCRKDKNNPLHVGEPGVGKTALVYGLAQLINDGKVPAKLQGSRIYQLDMGAMVAGTEYRGAFEDRLKSALDALAKRENAIVYIDEIHVIVGTGALGDSSMDASNILKPYLEDGKLRFIGSTTHEEYNRYLAKSKSLLRRFQQVDITEPSLEQAIAIVEGLKTNYEDFHNVTFAPDVVECAVRSAAKHIMGRFLPDKAIDLIDEAAAYCSIHSGGRGERRPVVTVATIDSVLQQVMKISATAMKADGNKHLKTLERRIKSRIYGQDVAVSQVVEAVMMSKAGLIDDNKPLASLLFVGPTGVGKTEVARVLSQELGVPLVRFDMSEYSEKYTVSKLIGTSAGYVGYEDGGLLTAAITKSPNCVLLLDEIEKAHENIYDILLQVMDYARLTDNKGRSADFRNVVLIMTSNCGAQYAGMSVGFDSHASRGGDMLKQVKKTFKPEFVNRLSSIVTFNDMDMTMAGLILNKKVGELEAKLAGRKVKLKLAKPVRDFLLKEGFTTEYGGREIDRVLHKYLKTPLVKEILFGRLSRGGEARFVMKDGVPQVVAAQKQRPAKK